MRQQSQLDNPERTRFLGSAKLHKYFDISRCQGKIYFCRRNSAKTLMGPLRIVIFYEIAY